MFSSLHLILIVIVDTFILGELVYLILETILKLQANIQFYVELSLNTLFYALYTHVVPLI